jgi:hypothetical protein
LLGDIGADTQNFNSMPPTIRQDSIGPGNSDSLPIAAHVLVYISFESRGCRANLFQQQSQIAVRTVRGRDDRAHNMAAEDFLSRIAKKLLAVFIQEGDSAVAAPSQDDAIGQFDQFAIFEFALGQAGFGSLAFGDEFRVVPMMASSEASRSALS